MTAKFRLELVELHCTRKQDTIGADEPKLLVDGVTVYGPGSVKKGGTINLAGRSAFLDKTAQVQLIEVDAGVDDDMGTQTVNGASSVGRGDQQLEYHRTHADYELTYQVVVA